MCRTACTEPQCLYKGALYLYLWSWKSIAIPLLPLWTVRPVQSLSACTMVHFTFTFGHERVELYLYSYYGPYGLYKASVPVQGCTLPLPLPLQLDMKVQDWINVTHADKTTRVFVKPVLVTICMPDYYWETQCSCFFFNLLSIHYIERTRKIIKANF